MLKLRDELPVDHRLARVYRFGAGLGGVFLLVFGILGLLGRPGFLDTQGDRVAGMSSNGLLGLLSVLVGLVLMAGAVIGGNVASWINMVVGTVFVLAGFVGLAIISTGANFLAFGMTNVIFSFGFGLVVATFGMYGRVSRHLPHDNPYWRERHARYAAGLRGPVGPPVVLRH